MVEYYPPAVPGDEQYTLQKFYSVSEGLVRTLTKEADLYGLEFPFRVSETEVASYYKKAHIERTVDGSTDYTPLMF
jgi:hypothetical protein